MSRGSHVHFFSFHYYFFVFTHFNFVVCVCVCVADRLFVIKVDSTSPSVFQSDAAKIFNTDIAQAYDAFGTMNSSTEVVSKSKFYKAIHLAVNLFAQRTAVERRIVLVSCGNCLDYSALDTLQLVKLLDERNVIVSSWGSYNLKDKNAGESKDADNDEDDEDDDNDSDEDEDEEESGSSDADVPIGYSSENVFLLSADKKSVSTDSVDGYTLEHSSDLCHRLAVRTDGEVFNLAYMRQANVFAKVLENLRDTKPNYARSIKRCQRVDTSYGDIDDFLTTRNRL